MKRKAKSSIAKMKKENVELAKKIAKTRDWYVCQRCWNDKNIHWSHIINEARDHRLACNPYNIKALCYNCHLNWWHKNPIEAGLWFREKFPWRWEILQEQHIANQWLWSISHVWTEDQNNLLKEIAMNLWIISKTQLDTDEKSQ